MSLRVVETQDLNTIIAKYYLPDKLFVFQVEELIDMLTEYLAERFPHIQAVNKANHFVAKYYLNISEAKADHLLFWEKQTENLRSPVNAGKQLTDKPSCFGSLKSACSNCPFYLQCLRRTSDRDLIRGF